MGRGDSPTRIPPFLSARPWHRPWTRCLKSSWEKPLPARALGQQPPTPPAPGPAARSLQAAAALGRTKPPEAPRPQRGRPHPQHRSPRAWTRPSSRGRTEVLPALLWAPPHPRQPVVRRATLPRPFASPWPCPASTEHLLLTFCREENVAAQIMPLPAPSPGLDPFGRQPRKEAGGRPLPGFAVRAHQWLLGDRCPCSDEQACQCPGPCLP